MYSCTMRFEMNPIQQISSFPLFSAWRGNANFPMEIPLKLPFPFLHSRVVRNDAYGNPTIIMNSNKTHSIAHLVFSYIPISQIHNNENISTIQFLLTFTVKMCTRESLEMFQIRYLSSDKIKYIDNVKIKS